MERPSEVEGLTFPQFQKWLAETWAPGEHWAVVAPTGEGKTVFLGALAKSRRYVLGLDIKGGDHTLSSFGWPRVKVWPFPYKYSKEMHDNERLRILIGGTDRTRKGRTERRGLLRRVLEDLMADRGWTVLCPDLMALTHRDLGQADAEMRELLILAPMPTFRSSPTGSVPPTFRWRRGTRRPTSPSATPATSGPSNGSPK